MTYTALPRTSNATASLLMRSLCSLMPISITLVTCSSVLSLPTASAAAAASPGSSRRTASSPAVNDRGGATEEDPAVCGTSGGGTHKHSFRSTGHPAVPDSLQLKQLVVICRHGDRAPVSNNLGKVLVDGPESVQLWNSKLPTQKELDEWSTDFPPRVLGDSLGQSIDEIARNTLDGPWGHLTSRGAAEMKLLGEQLRTVLDGGEGGGGRGAGRRLFPAGLKAERSSIFVRCTRVKRTHQSAQNVLKGLGLDGGVDLYVRPHVRETLWPSRRTRGKQNALIDAATANNNFPGQADLKAKIAEIVGVPEEDVKWTTVREVLACYEAHGVPLPAEAVSSGVVDLVLDYTGWMWGRWFNQREMARLSLGPFLAEMLTIMGARGQETGVPEAGMPSTPKLVIFSGHDSTLVPVLAALKIYDDTWPPYASYISLDVAEDERGQRLVRVVFNGKEAVLPGAEGAWIPLAALHERLEDVMPTAEDAIDSDSGDSGSSTSSEISAAVSAGSRGSRGSDQNTNK